MLTPYLPLDMLAAARWQYGANAAVWPMPAHAYDWAAKLPNSDKRYWLDLAGYVKARHGADARLILKGMSGADWAVFRPLATDYAILPVVLIATDKIYDVAGVRDGVACFQHNVQYVSDWYASQLGAGFRVVQALVIHSSRSVAEWKALYIDQTDRYDLYKACEAELIKAFGGIINENLTYTVTQYTGNTPEWDWDAAGGRMATAPGHLAVVSSFAACQKFVAGSMTGTDDAIPYALGHELGHTFDLPHTDPAKCTPYEYSRALMQRGFPPDACLVPYERDILRPNPNFQR